MRVLACSLKWNRLWREQEKRRWNAAVLVSMQMRGRDAEEYGGERKRRNSYAEVAKGNTKFVGEMLEPIFIRVAGHKWLGRRMGLVVDVCGFCGLAWAGMNVGTVAEGVKTSKVGCNMR